MTEEEKIGWIEDEREQAIKRGGKAYAEIYMEGLNDGYIIGHTHAMKNAESNLAFRQSLRGKVDPNNWCVLMTGLNTGEEYQAMGDYAYNFHKKVVYSKSGWYGCQNGVFCFSETGRFSDEITFAQFKTLLQ